MIDPALGTLQVDTSTTLSFTAGEVSTFVGQDSTGHTDGTGTATQFSSDASGIASDSSGNLYIADNSNHRIRKITTAGYVSTLAGSGAAGYNEDTGNSAQMDNPQGIAVFGTTVYFSDTDNHVVRSIDSGGTTSKVAGSDGNSQTKDGNANSSRFHTPTHMAVDSSNSYIYVLDSGTDKIRKIDLTAATNNSSYVTTFVSSGLSTSGGGGMVVDSSGNLYIADTGNHCIKKITSGGSVSVFAGSSGTSGDAEGAGTSARFHTPTDIAIDDDGYLYVTDQGNHKIKRINPSGDVFTLSGSGSSNLTDGDLFTAEFNTPHTIGFGNDTLYIKHDSNGRIRQMTKPDQFWVTDTDSASVSVTLTADNGTLTIDVSGGGSITSGSSGSATFTVNGTLDQVNAALATVQYDHNMGFTGTETITYSATDGTNATGDSTVSVLVRDNNAPVLSSIGNQTLSNHNSNVDHDFTVSDADGDTLTVTATKNSGDAAVTLTDNGSGNWNIYINPDSGFSGVISVTILVEDPYGGSDSETFFTYVNYTNSDPVLGAIGNQSTDEDVTKTVSLSATDSDGDSVSYSVTVNSGTVTASILGTDLQMVPGSGWSGTANITVTVEDGVGGSDSETFDLTVTGSSPAAQTITFTQDLTGKTFGDASFGLIASSDSGLTVSFASSDTSVVSISGTTATIVGAGSVNITAEQAGNDDYAYASVVQAMTIAKASQTITFPAIATQYESTGTMSLPATASSGLTVSYSSSNSSIVSVSGTTATFHQTGTVTITASQAGDDDYNAASDETASLTVDPEIQTITFLDKGETGADLRDYVLGPHAFLLPLAPITGGGSGNPVNVTITGGTAASGVTSSTITKGGSDYLQIYSTSTGTLQITATQAGGTNGGLEYAAATDVTREITLMAATLANSKTAMLDHPDYAGKYTIFSSAYTGVTNPDTGFDYTPSEIQALFQNDNSDPDGDGMSNILEYAFGTDRVGRSIAERKYIPRRKPLDRGDGTKSFQYKYYRRTSASDPNLSYVVETSSDMVHWSATGITEVSAVSTFGNFEVVTVQLDKAYTDADAPKYQFIRVNVTSSE